VERPWRRIRTGGFPERRRRERRRIRSGVRPRGWLQGRLRQREDGRRHGLSAALCDNPTPPYPREARNRGYQGEVLLRVEVLSSGKVGQIEIKRSSGYEMLDQSALSTVKQWKFIPAKRGEETVPLWVNIPIRFQIQ